MPSNELAVAIFNLATVGGVLFVAHRTVNRWLDRRHERLMARQRDPVPGTELRQVRDRLDMLEDLGERMQELEERLDFTERMLARQSKARIPGEGGL